MWLHLTPQRFWNIAVSILSEMLSRVINRPIIWGFPPFVSIEPSAYCNLRCPECPSGNGDLLRNRGTMRPELYKKILAEIATRSTVVQFFFQGEPFLNSNLVEMVQQASAAGLYSIISTNGHFLEENAALIPHSGLNKLIVSFDGMTSETYTVYRRGGDFEKVKRGIVQLLEEKKKQQSKFPLIELQFIVFQHNEHEIELFKRWCKSIGVNAVLKTAQIYQPITSSVKPPRQAALSRYTKLVSDQWVLKRAKTNSCLRLWQNPVICWDGTVAVCCYDKDAQVDVGNINHANLADIWKSTAFQHFRRSIIKGDKLPEMCEHCAK